MVGEWLRQNREWARKLSGRNALWNCNWFEPMSWPRGGRWRREGRIGMQKFSRPLMASHLNETWVAENLCQKTLFIYQFSIPLPPISKAIYSQFGQEDPLSHCLSFRGTKITRFMLSYYSIVDRLAGIYFYESLHNYWEMLHSRIMSLRSILKLYRSSVVMSSLLLIHLSYWLSVNPI